jgi:hypothetical protein
LQNVPQGPGTGGKEPEIWQGLKEAAVPQPQPTAVGLLSHLLIIHGKYKSEVFCEINWKLLNIVKNA